ncbi:hypothetical protein FRC12_022472 [Ceratobasidium sp. 428]|nr:hypothetical protein FRC12_022472 [Ceratobasidium sp. 428]
MRILAFPRRKPRSLPEQSDLTELPSSWMPTMGLELGSSPSSPSVAKQTQSGRSQSADGEAGYRRA